MNGYRLVAWLSVLTLAVVTQPPSASAQGDPNAPNIAGMQVLTRGPVHEAFAEPIVYDPQAGPIIPKEPPPQVEELPPDQQPEGTNVQWIPGYWSWDDERNDYLWISGIWRDIPPGRQWVPGYWSQVQGGFQWIAGAWVSTEQTQAEYLPEPPQSLEVGPNGPSPSPDATWAPGCWYWQETRYVWRPGYWVPFQPNWLWVPAHFVWTPNGYLYVNGYWDHPLLTRGVAFAPVYFEQPIYSQPNFVYTPNVGLLATALASSLFVRPSYQQYYFGDYYAASNFNSGIYPWYSYHQSRYGYDPLFSHYAAVNTRRDPRWVNELHDDYRYRRDHPEARPARTFVQQQSIVNNVNHVNNVTNINNVNVKNVTRVQNLVIGRPISQMAARGDGPGARKADGPDGRLRFDRIDDAQRRSFAQQANQLREFRQQRIRQEREFASRQPDRPQGKEQGKRANFPDQARRVDLPRSPFASMPSREGQGRNPNAGSPRDEPGRNPNAGNMAREAREAAKNANAARELNANREAREAAKNANAARELNANREAREAAKNANAARELNANREAREAAKNANAARELNANREAREAAKNANAARELNANREAREAAKNANMAREANAAREAREAAKNAARDQNANREAREAAKAANAARELNANREANAARAAREAAKNANMAREANAAREAREAAKNANAARELNANREAREAAKNANMAREANAARNAREANQAANAARQANAAQAANAARQVNAAREAAQAARQARQSRGGFPPPVPNQPEPDLNRRPANLNQFRQQRHEPDPNQLPPQFRRGAQMNGNPNAKPNPNPNPNPGGGGPNQGPRQGPGVRKDGTPKEQNKRQRD